MTPSVGGMNTAVTQPVPQPSDDPNARWSAVFARLLKTEGGFVDSPQDHGGATKYGLSLRFLAQEAKIDPQVRSALRVADDGGITVDTIRNLTVEEAQVVYAEAFWHGPGIDTLPAPFDAAVFDQAVNDGLSTAVSLLQKAINDAVAPALGQHALPVDGLLGPKTREALDTAIHLRTAPRVLDLLRNAAATHYRFIAATDPSQQKFLTGWLNRASELGDV